MSVALFLSALLLLANAFFVAAEFALVAARRSDIEQKKRSWLKRETLLAMDRVSLMMATAQIGITLCTIGLGALAKPALASLIEDVFGLLLPGGVALALATALALLIVALLHVVLGEMVPKNVALARPSLLAISLAAPLRVISFLFWPAVWLLNQLANGVLRLFGVRPKDALASTFTKEEVALLVKESREEGELERAESSLLGSALSFEERRVSLATISPEKWISLEEGDTPAKLEALSARFGYSRFPVFSYGELLGYLHLKDALLAPEQDEPFQRNQFRSLPILKKDDTLRQALETMQRYDVHLARVEEEGELVGIVALEDVLEELIGQVSDVAGRIVRVR